MIKTVPFQTRARTIDHLGREQIADCPTAISELWKNAYDAYARHVALNVFDGDVPIAAVTDDGHGMNEKEFLARWLVVGTDSKLDAADTPVTERLGLPKRARQGQKGIGRLSCAALGPMALIVSKRVDADFVGCLLDWRLFQNPFLMLQDIEVPVVSFSEKAELFELLPQMADQLVTNVWGAVKDKEKTARIEVAWKSFDDLEARQGRPSTRAAVEAIVVKTAFSERHMSQWSVWTGAAPSGTLILSADVVFDLTALLATSSDASHDSLISDARERTFRTLSSFVDPFIEPKEVKDEFHYRIDAWNADQVSNILSDAREFDISNFEKLEHIIDGRVDSKGVFKGRVKAFGTWLEEHITIDPKTPRIPTGPQTRVGPFQFRAGAYEGTRLNSTLGDEDFSFIDEQATRYGGLFLFRDGLRVLPFGRPDNDFFEIERRRTQALGREFWSYRRMFGSIGIASAANPNLRDKAGREGLIDNQSAKVFRQIVEGILTESARRYFGTRSDIRAEKLGGIQEENRARKAKEEQRKLAKKRREQFRRKVRDQVDDLTACLIDLKALKDGWTVQPAPMSEKALLSRRSELSALEQRIHILDVGEAPYGLQSFREEYDAYAGAYKLALGIISEMSDHLFRLLDELRNVDPVAVFEKERSKRQREIESTVSRHLSEISKLQEAAGDNLKEIGRQQVSAYVAQVNLIYREVMETRIPLSPGLKRLDDIFHQSRSEIEQLFDSLVATFEALRDNIDLNTVATSGLDDLSELRDELTKINALAQLGITVEIIGHELETLDASISRGLSAFPKDVQALPAFHTVNQAHVTLTDRLRFLSPLKLSGEQAKEWITGKDIVDHLHEFFDSSLERENVALTPSDDFLKFRVYDRRSRIFPVFINLANNSRYWIAQKPVPGGSIALALKGEKVVFADDGPGVVEEDVKSLFTLFFTRKARSGRGVGLYLCRTNLAAGGHRIHYTIDKKEQVLPGANFVIEFLGAEYG
jgi:signal transduction histidine kinase